MIDFIKRCIFSFLVMFFGYKLIAATGPGEFDLPDSLILSPEAINHLRALVKSDPDAYKVVSELKKDVNAEIGRPATPLKKIYYEGLVNTDSKRIESVKSLKQLGDAAMILRYWQATGDEKAARTLKDWMMAWFETYEPTGNDVNENKLFPLLVAAFYLRDDLNAESGGRLMEFVGKFAEPHVKAVKESRHMTNRYTKHVRLAMVCGMILDRPEWTALGEVGVKRFVRESLYADGSSLDLRKRDTLTYHSSALRPPLQIAMLSENPEELYTWENAEGASLKKSVEYVVPYAMGEKTREEWTNSKVGLDHQRAAAGIPEYQKGKLYNPQKATELMELAAYFDPELMIVVRHLSPESGKRFPTWQTLVNESISTSKAMAK